MGLDQHSHAIAHFVDAAEFAVEVTEADEVVRDVLWFLTGDEPPPSVAAERTFLAYGRDGRDVRVCVEIKILRHVCAESSRRPPRHRRDACSMAYPTHWLISTQVLTLKQPSASTKAAAADTGEVEAALAAGGFRDLRTAWLWANGRKERTLAATYT